MNTDQIRTNLRTQGLSDAIIDGIIKTMSKPVKEKTAKRWFPGAGSTSKTTKVDKDVECTIICECCGARDIEIRTIKATTDSPDTMKLPVAMCNQCPDYFRSMTHETLVSLCLVRRHAGLMHQHGRVSGQVTFAKNHTPEEIISFRTNHF